MPDLGQLKPGWYCFKALPKKEHIAARLLAPLEGIEVFCPRLAYFKKTRRGKVRFVECLFPGYLFVRADLSLQYRHIRSIQGIRDVVAFGERVPVIREEFIGELRARIGEENLKQLPDPVIEAGQTVTIAEGPFKDLQAIVAGHLDGRQRVALLLEFLGRQMQVSVPVEDVVPEQRQPKREIWEG